MLTVDTNLLKLKINETKTKPLIYLIYNLTLVRLKYFFCKYYYVIIFVNISFNEFTVCLNIGCLITFINRLKLLIIILNIKIFKLTLLIPI